MKKKAEDLCIDHHIQRDGIVSRCIEQQREILTHACQEWMTRYPNGRDLYILYNIDQSFEGFEYYLRGMKKNCEKFNVNIIECPVTFQKQHKQDPSYIFNTLCRLKAEHKNVICAHPILPLDWKPKITGNHIFDLDEYNWYTLESLADPDIYQQYFHKRTQHDLFDVDKLGNKYAYSTNPDDLPVTAEVIWRVLETLLQQPEFPTEFPTILLNGKGVTTNRKLIQFLENKNLHTVVVNSKNHNNPKIKQAIISADVIISSTGIPGNLILQNNLDTTPTFVISPTIGKYHDVFSHDLNLEESRNVDTHKVLDQIGALTILNICKRVYQFGL